MIVITSNVNFDASHIIKYSSLQNLLSSLHNLNVYIYSILIQYIMNFIDFYL